MIAGRRMAVGGSWGRWFVAIAVVGGLLAQAAPVTARPQASRLVRALRDASVGDVRAAVLEAVRPMARREAASARKPSYDLSMGPLKVNRGGVRYVMYASAFKQEGERSMWLDVSFSRQRSTESTTAAQVHFWSLKIRARSLNTKRFPTVVLNTRKALGKFGRIKVRFEAQRSKRSCKGKVLAVRGGITTALPGGTFSFKTRNRFFGSVTASSLRATLRRDQGCRRRAIAVGCGEAFSAIGAAPSPTSFLLGGRESGLSVQLGLRFGRDGRADVANFVVALVPGQNVTLAEDMESGSIATLPKTFFAGGAAYAGTADPAEPFECDGEPWEFQQSEGMLTGTLRVNFDGFPTLGLPPGGAEAQATRQRSV